MNKHLYTILMPQERRKTEVEQKTAAAAEDSDKSESKKVSSDNKENNSQKVDSSDRKEGSSESKEDSSETKAEGDKEAFIDLRPLTMEDLRQAKNQVSCLLPWPALHVCVGRTT